ncbi:hypothetical protein RHGRI_000518 [Rhododendron griersonianum]|uniref:Uncharacterized protein n=1 Tax=Rhododendron griersonianum TaxID=479676 RepID=A0AAV6LHV9_9ERIC|nr:hypothetical protein RHGRI_005881 [Rhododendron griersonianum]KAG5564346.1 hypothetical protein RHGRI_000518 [Rhododendron griersonianum]
MNKMGKQLSLPSARRKLKQERVGSDTLSLVLTLIRRRSSLSIVTLSTRSLYCFQWQIFSGQYLRLQVVRTYVYTPHLFLRDSCSPRMMTSFFDYLNEDGQSIERTWYVF